MQLYEWYKAKTFCCAFFAAAIMTMVAAATIVRFPPGLSNMVDLPLKTHSDLVFLADMNYFPTKPTVIFFVIFMA